MKRIVRRRDVLHAGTDRHDDTANLVAEDARIRCLARIKRERLEHVAEVHARGFDVDQHFTRAAGWQGERRKAQRIEVAALAGLGGLFFFGWKRRKDKPPNVPPLPKDDDDWK